MKTIAFYLMNSKGYFVLSNFIEKFGASAICYVISSPDISLDKDYYLEIKQLCEIHQINFFNKEENTDLSLTTEIPYYRFVIGWRWLIQDTSNLIVLHDSLLPQYRGFAPLVTALINQEKRIGVTALFATDEYDTGDILAQQSIEISYPMKIAELIKKSEPIYFELVSQLYEKINQQLEMRPFPQEHHKATYSLWLDKEDYFIDWSWPADKIKCFVDAVGSPYAGASARIGEQEFKLKDVEVTPNVDVINRKRHIGKIIFIKDDMPVVVCSQGLLTIKSLEDLNGEKVFVKFRTRFH